MTITTETEQIGEVSTVDKKSKQPHMIDVLRTRIIEQIPELRSHPTPFNDKGEITQHADRKVKEQIEYRLKGTSTPVTKVGAGEFKVTIDGQEIDLQEV